MGLATTHGRQRLQRPFGVPDPIGLEQTMTPFERGHGPCSSFAPVKRATIHNGRRNKIARRPHLHRSTGASHKNPIVELRGFEPLTPTLPAWWPINSPQLGSSSGSSSPAMHQYAQTREDHPFGASVCLRERDPISSPNDRSS